MIETNSFLKELRRTANSSVKRSLTGKHALTRDLFCYLLKRTEFSYDFLFLCTTQGLILVAFSRNEDLQLSGYSIALDNFKPVQNELSFSYIIDGLVLITSASQEAEVLIHQIQSNLKTLLDIFDQHTGQQQYLLSCLDSVDNAICIYDKNATLLFGNKAYFKNMHISDTSSAIGMHISDITRESKITVHPSKHSPNSLKMLDVLKTGRQARDWEFSIESQSSPNNAQLYSVNMYPILNKSSQVDGMIEVSSSHQVNLSKTKRMMGLNAEYTFDSILGKSPSITTAIDQAKEYASSPYSLLIVGESGVGKELFAQAIHNYSNRRHESFVALNCANFPENLIESELFGYVGGAFTGAAKQGQMGKFELANGGTLFLDEIGELPLNFQSKLLRVLETKKITRIGSATQTSVDVRVLAATNRDLEKMIEEGLFRKDLYYRLQVLNIEIPPLRERREDLPLLAEAFFRQAAEVSGERVKHLDNGAKKCLIEYSWPGNVRELRNVIQRVTLLSKTETISKETLESAIFSKGYALNSRTAEPSEIKEDRLQKSLANVDRAYAELLNNVLDITNGNKKQAAELLGVSRQTIYRMIEKYLKKD